jgi:hypothetical protein
MNMWTLVKALLLKDLIGFCIGVAFVALFALVAALVAWREQVWDKKHPYAVRKGEKR